MKNIGEFFNFAYVVIFVAGVVSAQLSDSPAESSTHASENQPIDVHEKNKDENPIDLKSLDKKLCILF